MPRPSITMKQYLDYHWVTDVWRTPEDIPEECYLEVFGPTPEPGRRASGSTFDYITPILRGKQWLLEGICQYQPRTGKLLLEGSELVVRITRGDHARMAIEVNGRVVLLYRNFYGDNPGDETYPETGKSYRKSMPEAIQQGYYSHFSGMSLPPEPLVGINNYAFPQQTICWDPVNDYLGNYRGAKKKYLPWFEERFPEFLSEPDEFSGKYENFRCWLTTRIASPAIRELTPEEQRTLDRKDPIDALFMFTNIADSPIYHVVNDKLDEMRILADPAEAVDRYCEHVLLGKEERFDFLPWTVPLD